MCTDGALGVCVFWNLDIRVWFREYFPQVLRGQDKDYESDKSVDRDVSCGLSDANGYRPDRRYKSDYRSPDKIPRGVGDLLEVLVTLSKAQRATTNVQWLCAECVRKVLY